ncbi:transposase [Denitratisoma oestradiolicum]|nr:transposase [Denitratisoma oestradiolicum]
MFRFAPGLKVYLHREAVDGRKSINGLALLVEQALEHILGRLLA